MYVDETLELDYLIEEVSRDTITVNKDPNGSSINYISRETGIFDPQGTGTYEIDINGQVIEIEVTDIPDSGLLHEYDARELSSAGTFTDQQGNKDLSSNGSPSLLSSGIGGNQTVRYDGVDDEHVDGNSVTVGSGDEYTSVFVYQFQSLPGTTGALNNGTSGSNGYLFREESGSSQFNWTHTGVANNTGGTPDTSAHIIVASYDGSTLFVDVDNSEIINTTSGINTPSGGYSLGSENGERYAEIDIGHHLHYDEYYDSSGRTDIYDALKLEWGL